MCKIKSLYSFLIALIFINYMFATANDSLKVTTLLASMVDQDQALRSFLINNGYVNEMDQHPEYVKKMTDMNAEHLEQLKKIIKEHGWPTISKFGKEASNNAWLLVQHAENAIPFQEECLKYLQEALTSNDIEPQNYAYLFDRIQVNKGLAQRYGTQIIIQKGEVAVHKLENPELVDQYRKEVGLLPLAEYMQLASEIYKLKSEEA